MRKRSASWFLAVTSFAYAAHAGCVGTSVTAGSPASTARGEGHYGYVMSQVSSAIVVIDTGTNEVVRRGKHADMVKPAGGGFPPSLKRDSPRGSGKIPIWDTTDLSHPTYLKTVIPAAGSTGEYRGFLIHRGSRTAIDGTVWMASIQDSKVYVYRAADLESAATPTPVKVFDTAGAGISVPHFMMSRPGTSEIWLTNRPVNGKGFLMRFDGNAHTVITTPTVRLETASTVG